MKYYYFFIILFSFKAPVHAQIKDYSNIIGIYKLYTKINEKDSSFRGYINFKSNNKYFFFGRTGYTVSSNSGDVFLMYSSGKWGIKKSREITLKDDKVAKKNAAYNILDSLNYQGSFRQPFDSNFYFIQVFDDLLQPLNSEIIYFKNFNRLVESDSNGFLKYSFKRSANDSSEEISFISHKPVYPATIKINPEFNHHHINIYLKKIPNNGFIQDNFYPLYLKDSLIKNEGSFYKFKYNSLQKVNNAEVIDYIDRMQNFNLIFFKEFTEIKKSFF